MVAYVTRFLVTTSLAVHTLPRAISSLACLIACAGGRTCPATGLPLPNRVILRADLELQRRILLWAAEQGLEVPTSPSLGLSEPLAGGSGKRVKLLAGLRRQVKKALVRLRKFFEESPKLYPALGDNSWAQRL